MFYCLLILLSLVCCLKVKQFVDATVESPKTLSGSEKNKQLSGSKIDSEEVDNLCDLLNQKKKMKLHQTIHNKTIINILMV